MEAKTQALVKDTSRSLTTRYRRYQAGRQRKNIPRPPVDPMRALLEAFEYLENRGSGAGSWAPALADHPLAFILDSIEDALIIRNRSGKTLYANRSARRLPKDIEEQKIRRRTMIFSLGKAALEIEVIHNLDD